MGKKIKVWLDSGANIHSKYEQVVDLEDEYGISEEEWDEMSSIEQEDFVRDIAFSTLDWGWVEDED